MTLRSTLILLTWVFLTPAMFAMRVGTFNIRYDNPADAEARNAWSQRSPIVTSLIRFHDFDVIGIQEAFQSQILDLQRLMPEYTYTSHGRDDGKFAGEHVGIFYKKDRFDLMESGFFWLSETPDRPGKGWDADLPRICTWARLHEKSTSRTFCFFSVHLDHRGSHSRHESIRLILRKISEISGDDPVILVGDFNTDQNSKTYQLIGASGRLIDAAMIANITYLLNGTANGFNPNRETKSRIDHVFVSTGTQVLRFGVLTDTYRIPNLEPNEDEHQSTSFPAEVKFKDYEARLPSDHFPVLVEIAYP